MSTIDKQTKSLIEGITSLNPVETVKSDDDLKIATGMLANVKSNVKQIKAKKKAALDPLKASIKEINSWFKPAEDRLSEIEKSIKDAMLVYHDAKEAAARKEAERIERRLDKGTMRVDTGIAKLAGIDQADSNVHTENGSAQFRQSADKVRITDVRALVETLPELLSRPRVLEAIRLEVAADYKLSTVIPPGVDVYREKIVAGATG